MKGKMLKGTLLAVAALAFSGANPLPMRLDVKGSPEGAEVSVDGVKCGKLQEAATCSATQLAPGLHLLHVEAKYHWPLDMYVRLGEAENFVTKDVSLKPMYGLVLVKSNPAGATVTYRGRDLGKTPLLIDRDLQCRSKPHTLELTLNGYRKTTVDVGVPDRTPKVIEPSLEMDAGLLNCTSEPAGATVFVDGIEQKDVTPTEIMIPRGGANLTFRLAGYKDEKRSVSVPAGKKDDLHVPMQGLPARLTVVTEPEKATVYLDGNTYMGKSPITGFSVNPGTHDIRVELSGYATATRTVELPNGGELTERLVLESVLGRIQVSTDPIGAKISLDGRSKGTTGSGESGILTIEDVGTGDHTVEIDLAGFHSQSHKITVRARETAQLLNIKLKRDYSPDIDIEKNDGSHVKGRYRRQDANNIYLDMPDGALGVLDRPIPRETIRHAIHLKTGLDILNRGESWPPVADPAK